MSYPRPLATDFFYNRTARAVKADDILAVREDRTDDAELPRSEPHEVRLRVIKGGPPNAMIECEVCLPHALHWRRYRAQ